MPRSDNAAAAIARVRAGSAQVLPLVALGALLWLFYRHVQTLDPNAAWASFRDIHTGRWLVAVLATGASFWAIGHYDVIAHRWLGTGIPKAQARRAGLAAIAISQTTGFGIVTGALVRWRCLKGLNAWQATRISLTVSLSFLCAWAVLCAAGVTLTGGALVTQPILRIGAGLGLGGLALGLIFRKELGLPEAPRLTGWNMGVLLMWAALDTALAAFALWVVLPAANLPDPATFYVIYLLALGAGMLSSAPAGLGAFELTILFLLPGVDGAELLAGLLAYRIIYFAGPALLGLAHTIRPQRHIAPPTLQDRRMTDLPGLIDAGAPADWALARQGAALATHGMSPAGWLYRDLGWLRVTIGPPFGGASPRDFARFSDAACMTPVCYKVDANTAGAARAMGWRVLRTAQEAIIDTRHWRLDTPGRRQLRRKLRHAEKAGVRIIRAAHPLPLDQMRALADEWVTAHGAERGFSMGRFEAGLLADQAVFLAVRGTTLLGFVTFHVARPGWSLDLMRHLSDLPDGAMHALVTAGINAAADAGAARVSLAAVPDLPGRRLGFGTEARGLRQFKQSFDPFWQSRFLCAPNLWSLIFTGCAIGYAIHRPPA